MYWSSLTFLLATVVVASALSLHDLMQALHTFEKVWIRYRSFEKRTLGHKHKCVYSKVHKYNSRHYFLIQHYEVNGKWRTTQSYATLLQGKGGDPIMRLSYRPGTNQCEMWVWGDHVRKHVPQCQMAYKQHCLAQYPVYTHACGKA
ncbi:uncharacterized protein LOC119168099 isoform X2 [Rhipicephalus microplus]|uniref:uncharacterized protein LOC119168099 isoform X2 n=1 Tax=Rhipicephalus microplus TaxID=6941 RepID=UPI003F6BD41B